MKYHDTHFFSFWPPNDFPYFRVLYMHETTKTNSPSQIFIHMTSLLFPRHLTQKTFNTTYLGGTRNQPTLPPKKKHKNPPLFHPSPPTRNRLQTFESPAKATHMTGTDSITILQSNAKHRTKNIRRELVHLPPAPRTQTRNQNVFTHRLSQISDEPSPSPSPPPPFILHSSTPFSSKIGEPRSQPPPPPHLPHLPQVTVPPPPPQLFRYRQAKLLTAEARNVPRVLRVPQNVTLRIINPPTHSLTNSLTD